MWGRFGPHRGPLYFHYDRLDSQFRITRADSQRVGGEFGTTKGDCEFGSAIGFRMCDSSITLSA